MTIYEYLVIYLAIINSYAILTMWFDKRKAQMIKERTKATAKYRTAERTLFTIAACGGALGIYIGMYAFRHKTLHWQFKYGIPILFIFNMICMYYILKVLG